jgi:hypothetical protein
MVIVDAHIVWGTEPCTVTSGSRVWGDVRENGEDELVREFEDWENGMRRD